MNNPLVTVITPTYNCGKYLCETMESVLSQSYRNIQYVVIDDCSTDNTQAILAIYSDTRLTVIRNKKNMGEHRSVNEGLYRVEGKYFMYPNADDPLLPGAIEKLVEVMEANPELLCAYPDWYVINENSDIVHKVQTREYDFAWMVRHHTCIPSVGSIFRSRVIHAVGLRDPGFRWVSDFDYWLRIGLAGPMIRVPYTLACWRKHGTQASGVKSDARAKDHIRLMQKFSSRIGTIIHAGVVTQFVEGKDAWNTRPHERYNKAFAVYRAWGEAMCWAHLVAGSISGSKLTALKHFARAVMFFPVVLLSFQTYYIIYTRLIHAWRKGI